MRYSSNETTVLGGFFEEGKTVTIKIIDSVGELVGVDNSVCTASSGESTLYLWDTANMAADEGTYFYVMTDGVDTMPGKFTYGGSVDSKPSEINDKLDVMNTDLTVAIEAGNVDIRAIIEDVQLGNWELKDNQMVMLDRVGVELARFDLFDSRGNPTMNNVFKRERVG